MFLLCRLLVKSVQKKYFSYFSTKTYVVGTQENHLNVLKWIDKKIFAVLS